MSYPITFLSNVLFTPLLSSLILLPIFFQTGVPLHETLRVSELFVTKLVENEVAVHLGLQVLMASSDAHSTRGFTVASYAF